MVISLKRFGERQLPGYISEFKYFGTSNVEFVEIAVPTGTDVSGYTLQFYQGNGTNYKTVSLGTFSGTFAGQDVYVFDQSTPGFDSSNDPSGTFYSNDAIALVDDSGTVIQFVSWEGNTINAIEGSANGLSSTNVGSGLDSIQSDDGGATYFAQSNSNKGSIPACYAPGTVIDTCQGPRRIEDLREGDQIWTADNGAQTIRWIWRGTIALDHVGETGFPVLIKAGALAPGVPHADLIVSPQHRILVGGSGQLGDHFEDEVFVPSKSLTNLPGIRFLRGRKSMHWVHFSCDRHEVVRANKCWSESLYLGPMVMRKLPRNLRAKVGAEHQGTPSLDALNGPLARRCLTVGQAERALRNTGCPAPFTRFGTQTAGGNGLNHRRDKTVERYVLTG